MTGKWLVSIFSVAFWNNWILRSCWITKWRNQTSADQEHVPLMLSSPHTREKKVQVIFPFWWFFLKMPLHLVLGLRNSPKNTDGFPMSSGFPIGKMPKKPRYRVQVTRQHLAKRPAARQGARQEWGKRIGKHWERYGHLNLNDFLRCKLWWLFKIRCQLPIERNVIGNVRSKSAIRRLIFKWGKFHASWTAGSVFHALWWSLWLFVHHSSWITLSFMVFDFVVSYGFIGPLLVEYSEYK